MKISIIVPVYNCEDYIERVVNSVLIQNYKNFELIIINDGSTDSTKEKLKQFKQQNIKIISQKNNGVSNARNKGLSIASGDLICFLDADDYIDQNYFQKIINYFSKNPSIQLLNFGYFSETSSSNFDVFNYKEKLYKNHKEIQNDFINLWDSTMLYNVWNKVYLRDIIEKKDIKFPNINYGEDIIFNRLYLDSIVCMYNSSSCFYHYLRERNGSITKQYINNIFEIRKKEFYEFNEYFEKWKLNKELYYEFSCRRYIERVIACIENVHSSKMNFKKKYAFIKKVIRDELTKETLKYAKPRSRKIRAILIPIRLKNTLMTYWLGKIIHVFRVHNPELFNKIKNKSRSSYFYNN
ncbi:MAG: glycosyltransferase family 2 protein [Bacilli bacterium]|nr:glycosyltransferase family 2 protein [Bacilli bacterium]